MRKSLFFIALGFAAAMTTLSEKALALPIDGVAGRVAAEFTGLIEQVQYRHPRFVNERARQSYIDNRWRRMKVQQESDGTILLPGIETDRRGRTILRGAPRSRDFSGQRIGVWKPVSGTGGRLGTGSVPQVNKRKH